MLCAHLRDPVPRAMLVGPVRRPPHALQTCRTMKVWPVSCLRVELGLQRVLGEGCPHAEAATGPRAVNSSAPTLVICVVRPDLQRHHQHP